MIKVPKGFPVILFGISMWIMGVFFGWLIGVLK